MIQFVCWMKEYSDHQSHVYIHLEGAQMNGKVVNHNYN